MEEIIERLNDIYDRLSEIAICLNSIEINQR